jgi:hypothetical protein
MSLPAGKQNQDAISTFIEHFLGCEAPRPEGQGLPGNKSVKCLLTLGAGGAARPKRIIEAVSCDGIGIIYKCIVM